MSRSVYLPQESSFGSFLEQSSVRSQSGSFFMCGAAETVVRLLTVQSLCTAALCPLPYISGLGKCTQKLGVGAVYTVMNPKTPRVLP